MRARNIKPGFYTNEDLAECSIWARFIFPGLWMAADRAGRLEDRPKRLKAALLPFDNPDVNALLDELQAHGFIIRYRNSDGSFIQILRFSAHQSPHYSEKQSTIKPPDSENPQGINPCGYAESKPEEESKTPGKLPEEPENPQGLKGGSQPPDSLIPDSLIPDCGFSDSPNPDSETSPLGVERDARASKLPSHWRPSAELEQAAYIDHPEWTPQRFEQVLADFRDHWVSKGERRADWDAAWRKWVRNERGAQRKPGWGLQERNLEATAGWVPGP